MTDGTAVTQIPGDAFDATAKDICAPSVAVLGALNLLPSTADLEKASGFQSIFTGPPQSVAVIEAGITAASKLTTGASAATILGIWVAVKSFWGDNEDHPATQRMILLSAAIATAALILTIGYILASDVRGRAAAMVATINARAGVAETVLRVAAKGPSSALTPAAGTGDWNFTTLSASSVENTSESDGGEPGWTALALRVKGDGTESQVLVAKGDKFAWAETTELKYIRAL